MNKTLYKGVFLAIICKKCKRGVNKERIGSKIERTAYFLFAVLIMFGHFSADQICQLCNIHISEDLDVICYSKKRWQTTDLDVKKMLLKRST